MTRVSKEFIVLARPDDDNEIQFSSDFLLFLSGYSKYANNDG